MQFRVLGPIEVYDGQRRIELGSSMPRAVLALLLMNAGRVVPLDRLIDELWAGEPPASATGTLQNYVSSLRRALEPERLPRSPFTLLVTQAPGYVVHAAPEDVDSLRFDALVAQGTQELAGGRPAAARDALAQGLKLWRGAPYAEFTYESFAHAEIGRLTELRELCQEAHVEAELALGEHRSVMPELERLATAAPLRERRWELLALALYRSGRQAEALRSLNRARSILAEELGIDPGPGLRRLEDDILAQAADLDWQPPGRATTLAASLVAPVRTTDDGPRPLTLIGRRQELACLETALEMARRGHHQTVLVSGEPGIGKTRLVEELARNARAVDAGFVVWGRCPETEGVPPYWPWAQVLVALVDSGDAAVTAAARPVAGELAQLVPQVKELVGDLRPPPALDAATARFRLHRAVSSFLAGVAAARPLLVVIDDLQWADPASLELARVVASEAAAPIALVATYRDVDAATEKLADFLGALARTSNPVRIRLGGLDLEEAGELVAQATDARPSASAMAALCERTEGNPFFVVELARLLSAEGRWDGRHETGDALVPEAVADVIRRRLGRLPDATCRLLEVAAVAGRDFDVGVLAAASGSDEDDALDVLDVALAAGLVVDDRSNPGTCRFSHAIVQETVYAGLSAMRRALLHAKVAGPLESRRGADPVWASQIARQFRLAAPVTGVDPAIRWEVAAADVALARLAWEQAEQHLRAALELAGRKADDQQRWEQELDIQHRLAVLLSLTAGYQSPSVAEAWLRARELSGRLGDARASLTSLWGLARQARSRSQLELSGRIGEQLLSLGRQSSDAMFDVAGHESCGIAAFYAGDLPAAMDHLSKVIGLAGLPRVDRWTGPLVMNPLVLCRSYLANAAWLTGDNDRAEDLIAGAVGMSRSSESPMDRAQAVILAAHLATLRGDWRRTEEWAAEILEVSQKGGVGPLVALGDLWAAWAAQDDLQGALQRFDRALAELLASGWRLALSYVLWLLADLQRRAARADDARRTVERALAEAETTGERYMEAPLCQLMGELVASGPSPRLDEAEWWLRRAMAVSAEQQATALTRRAAESLSLIRSSQGVPTRSS